ncbi:hypothetical protein [Streptomyces anandii]|uniref:hypothetical protein n=1 Tax=Streptomyces anandii TaxID=285454 RepID=UPI0037880954
MASRASSETPAPAPRVEIPALPRLGTTWFERGAPYWLHRTRTAVGLLIVMSMACAFALAFYMGFREVLPPGVRVVWDTVQAIAACAVLVWGWVQQRRGHREQLHNPPTPLQSRLARRDQSGRAPGLVALGRGLAVLAAPVMPALVAYAVGWLTAWLTVREYPSEVGARRWMERR